MAESTLTTVHPLPVDDYLEVVGPDIVRVRGHRIGLEHIVERYQEGFSPEQISLDFPGVSLAQIYGVITYYLSNQAEVDAYIARVDVRAEIAYQRWITQPPSPATIRIRALKAQRAQGSS
jgi:uncharacterized protein (DUF433 family)